MKYKLYSKLWNEIDRREWPQPGDIYICLDPQKRLGERTWSVGIMGDGSMPQDNISLGLFWRIELAQRFALCVSELLCVQELQAERLKTK